MKYLGGEEVLVIHSEIIEATGGLHGVRDAGLFLSIFQKPKMMFGGKELYKSVFEKAAVYFEAFANLHIFIDGNKRTAIAAAARFLFLNKFELKATNREVENFVEKAVIGKLKIQEIAKWIKSHSQKLK